MSYNSYYVITICGSMRFFEKMLKVASQLTAEGNVVLMPFVTKGEEVDAQMLDDMHRQKIDMSSEIIVVSDATGYYGESTMNEIEYARDTRKGVSFYKIGD